ncbi:hypothetical protein OSB04_027958 [Centaurea solstitialis]|uniref:Uncharacterized protein n=1 Tax=Centaurea solstitialis TaxID=347529 RepID=A0AA38SYB8_9ASTR|nr:hypothetical protein OSB04_027958 [Centaurea solstitialis]
MVMDNCRGGRGGGKYSIVVVEVVEKIVIVEEKVEVADSGYRWWRPPRLVVDPHACFFNKLFIRLLAPESVFPAGRREGEPADSICVCFFYNQLISEEEEEE